MQAAIHCPPRATPALLPPPAENEPLSEAERKAGHFHTLGGDEGGGPISAIKMLMFALKRKTFDF